MTCVATSECISVAAAAPLADNNICEACQTTGKKLWSCTTCPGKYHRVCIPAMHSNKSLCPRCNAKLNFEQIPSGIFASAMKQVLTSNPSAFKLPSALFQTPTEVLWGFYSSMLTCRRCLQTTRQEIFRRMCTRRSFLNSHKNTNQRKYVGAK